MFSVNEACIFINKHQSISNSLLAFLFSENTEKTDKYFLLNLNCYAL